MFLINLLNDLKIGALNDAKSSAGDKHETAISMMQLEQEKINKQLIEIIETENALKLINPNVTSVLALKGSIVTTSVFTYFIAAPLGKINVNNTNVMVISASSPIAILILGKKAGDVFTFNNLKQTIIRVS